VESKPQRLGVARRGLAKAALVSPARLWWIPAALLAAGSAAADLRGGDPIDIPLFLQASHVLFSTAWLDTFANPQLQAGPVLIAALGACERLASLIGVSALGLVAFVVQLGTVGALMAVVGRLLRHHPGRRWAQLAAGVALVALGVAHGAYRDGHPAQVLIPLLWVLAGLDAREGKEVRAGALIGLSAGLELWGVLGAAVLVLGRRRQALTGLGVEAAVVAVLFAPFVFLGDFRMFEYRWLVTEGTLATLVLERGELFSWPMRLVQAASALTVGAALAWRLKRSLHAVWAVPLAVVVVRVTLDPSLNSWYLQAVQTLAIVGAVAILTDKHLRALWRRRRVRPISAEGPAVDQERIGR